MQPGHPHARGKDEGPTTDAPHPGDLFQKKQRGSIQSSVVSRQFSVFCRSLSSRQRSWRFVHRLWSFVSPTKLALRRLYSRAGRPGAEAICAKINLLSTCRGRCGAPCGRGLTVLSTGVRVCWKRLLGFAGAQPSLRDSSASERNRTVVKDFKHH
jgi:hypothetical protein